MTENQEWTLERVRKTFVDYFVSKHEHEFVVSSPVVPYDDPTLLFANAGMNQFKPCFLGQITPGSALEQVKRAANSQKCIRAGGKHNDLEDVGKDTYHHTFFEMMGNWSFGDYFKKEAIGWAWDLLVNVYKLNPAQMYATYFGGDEAQKLDADEEARQLWLQFLPDDRVLPSGMKDNFWEMGETGPCGPCSELHFDRIGGRNAASLVNKDDADVIEIWNLVFIQFNRTADTKLHGLPKRHVDTGLGLERLLSILQKKSSNYDTDAFTPIFAAIQREVEGIPSYTGKLGVEDKGNFDTAYRVIADHIRTLTFAIADGARPSNEGRGYVLRRILRRAVRFGKQIFNAPDGFFNRMVKDVVAMFGGAYPELIGAEEHVRSVIEEEEQQFGRTLARGLAYFNSIAEKPVTQETKMIEGADAFILYDTHGFPIDLTQQMAAENGLKVDIEEYENQMKIARQRSRDGGKSAKAGIALQPDHIEMLQQKGVPATNDEPKFAFNSPIDSEVLVVFTGGGFVDSASVSVSVSVSADEEKEEKTLGLVLRDTNFYAESGGQVGDSGKIEVLNDAGAGVFVVEDVVSFGVYVLHVGHVESGSIGVGSKVHLTLNEERRAAIGSNHTATHVLNHALRLDLGPDVDQKGSLVEEARLRFDFSHNGPVPTDKLRTVEDECVKQMTEDRVVYSKVIPLADAQSISALRAVFGERYPDPVRVVSVGVSIEDLLKDPSNEKWFQFSIELCGGTHLASAGLMKKFAIVSEEGIARGVRRIIALTGEPAGKAIELGKTLADELAQGEKKMKSDASAFAAFLKGFESKVCESVIPSVAVADLRKKLEALIIEARKSGKEDVAGRKDVLQKELVSEFAAAAESLIGRFVVKDIGDALDARELSPLVDAARIEGGDVAVMLIMRNKPKDGKGKAKKGKKDAPGSIWVDVPASLVTAGLTAPDWLKIVTAVTGGTGGGRPDRAQGLIMKLDSLDSAILMARQFASVKLGGDVVKSMEEMEGMKEGVEEGEGAAAAHQ